MVPNSDTRGSVGEAVREWLTVREFLERYKGKISRNTVYSRIEDKTLPSIKLGRKILLPADALDLILTAGIEGKED